MLCSACRGRCRPLKGLASNALVGAARRPCSGAFAVFAGLLFVDKVGAGPFAGLTITANILMSLAIDHFGLFGMPVHQLNIGRVMGGLLMVIGITLVTRF